MKKLCPPHSCGEKKMVVKLEIYEDKEKTKAMNAVSRLSGVDSISIDMKDKKLTVVGDVDPVVLVKKLKKLCHAELLSVGPAKEPEKKKDDKKDDDKKKEQQIQDLLKAYQNHNPYVMHQYVHHSAEENPNACVIS
ncbi:hypothetical protein DCAR_0209445 [Daucus carota subsp. sativus]|uniref:HMA domain-containing protein n=1 Tax=Daucus carota subsp. sativus TaxID=79200 RepID=A0AAF0WHW1_DAUCS|nr:hypothetical protein DCAR_0209445 [Daucus carota subsp. sativus]